MAVLSDTDRAEIWANFMRRESRDAQAIGVLKSELRAAVDAIDLWVENNQASFNAALPEPAKSNLSARQKALILFQVVNRRFEVI